MTHFAVGMPGPFELIIVLVIVLIFFGVGKLPRVLSQMGKGVRAFKDGMSGDPNADGEAGEIDITPDDPPAIAENPAPAMEDAEEVTDNPAPDEIYGDTVLDEPDDDTADEDDLG